MTTGPRAGEASPCPTDASPFTAELSQPVAGTTVCAITGAITADTAPVLRDAFARARGGTNASHLIIDLSAVTCLDSHGLSTLLEARHRHRTGGGVYLAAVINPQSPTIAELYLVSLEASFEVHDTLVAALQACAATATDT